ERDCDSDFEGDCDNDCGDFEGDSNGDSDRDADSNSDIDHDRNCDGDCKGGEGDVDRDGNCKGDCGNCDGNCKGGCNWDCGGGGWGLNDCSGGKVGDDCPGNVGDDCKGNGSNCEGNRGNGAGGGGGGINFELASILASQYLRVAAGRLGLASPSRPRQQLAQRRYRGKRKKLMKKEDFSADAAVRAGLLSLADKLRALKIMPAELPLLPLLKAVQRENDKLREGCSQASEILLLHYPAESGPYVPIIAQVGYQYIKYDPNYSASDDEDNEMADADNNDEDADLEDHVTI
ncbi:hypothetical protein GG344DRAFT_71088, partial [Lentinula edodes]